MKRYSYFVCFISGPDLKMDSISEMKNPFFFSISLLMEILEFPMQF